MCSEYFPAHKPVWVDAFLAPAFFIAAHNKSVRLRLILNAFVRFLCIVYFFGDYVLIKLVVVELLAGRNPYR